jgi:hypothetical protein
MPTPNQVDAQTTYANILEEIKLRIAATNHCTSGLSGIAPPFVKEFFYLQVRMICELVALGCLVAHGDIRKINSLHDKWSADEIMKRLTSLHPHFYPQAIVQTRTSTGFHLQAVEPSPLSKDQFLTLYGRCGDMPHRGNVKKLLKGQFPTQINYPELVKKAQPLIDLLGNHVLVMHSGEQMFLAMLSNADDKNRVQVAIAETPKGSPMDFKSPNFLKDPPDPR